MNLDYRRLSQISFSLIFSCVLLLACAKGIPLTQGSATQSSSPTNTSSVSQSATLTPFLPLPPTSTINPSPTFVPALWVAPYLPSAVQGALVLLDGFGRVDTPEQALLRLEPGDQHPLSKWVYALVTPFPTIPDGVSADELRSSWQGKAAGPFAGKPILIDESTLGVFTTKWGAPPEQAVKVLPADELITYAWEHRPAWALVPFEALQPRWKVLQVDGRSPLWKEFDPDDYALTVTFSLQGDLSLVPGLDTALQGVPATNRDPAKLTTVILTGVTALVRATAFTMHQKGILYPGQDIREITRDADLMHVSNEIPFFQDCPFPDPNQMGLKFCSDPQYIDLLKDIGTDIIELTGDHFADYGADPMRYTLDLYNKEGWIYYGGGYNLEDGRQARLIERNGTKFAFIGCNSKKDNHFYATASVNNPGAVACDFAWMNPEITRLRDQGYQVIVTFQDDEYYTYLAQPDQITDSHGVADAGAVIVSGSQAHQPQAMELYNNSFIHYGLGNLFFDQFFMGLPTSQGFLDRYVFYDGRFLSIEPIGILFVDYARPRLMTPAEKQQLMETVFSASGW